MVSLLGQTWTAFRDAKVAIEYRCRLLKSAIMQSTEGRRLRMTLRRRWQGVRSRTGDLQHFVRNNMARFKETEEPHASTPTPTPSLPVSAPRHQPMQDTTRSMSYMNMLLPCQPLLPVWSMEEKGKGGEKRGQGSRAQVESEGNVVALQKPFTSEALEDYLVRTIQSRSLEAQLTSIPRQEAGLSQEVSKRGCNSKKNRYKNNIPYDDTRVVLEGEGDYINASYIEGISGPRHFIATQGPKETNDRTLDDFWRMVWQNKTNVIVMLGNLIEGGRGKVSQYWPDSGEDRYGEVMVQKMSERSCFDHIRRHFIVAKGADSRELLHYQYFGWPDHDVPGSPVGAANMIKDVTRWHWSGPPVIHCSAGLGRTGTFLLVLCVLDELRTKGVFHPLNTLRGIRRCRANVLDNVNQYRFAQHVLLEILFGERTRSYLHKFPAYMSFNRNHLASQYKELKSYPKNLTYDWARSHDPIMNRDNSVLPPDGRYIILKMNDLINDKYMNMVRVRGANLRDTFLVTEHPMAHTVARVWRIAYMAKVSVWIFIHEYEPDDEAFPSVLPTTDQGELEGITIRVTGKVERAFFTERTVTVSEDKLQPHKIRLIHCKKWKPDRDLPSPPQSLLHLAEHMEELRRASPGSVVMISCCDGYSGSGLFVALSRMMAELQLSKQVDVYRTVQSVMFDRPQFIINERQYLYLHDAVLVYFKVQKMIQGSQQKEIARKQNKTMEGSTTATARELAARTSLQEAESMAMVREREANKRIEARGNGNIGNKGNKSALRHTISYGESTENEEIKYDPGRVSDAPEYRDHGAKPRKLKHPVYENIWQ